MCIHHVSLIKNVKHSKWLDLTLFWWKSCIRVYVVVIFHHGLCERHSPHCIWHIELVSFVYMQPTHIHATWYIYRIWNFISFTDIIAIRAHTSHLLIIGILVIFKKTCQCDFIQGSINVVLVVCIAFVVEQLCVLHWTLIS